MEAHVILTFLENQTRCFLCAILFAYLVFYWPCFYCVDAVLEKQWKGKQRTMA